MSQLNFWISKIIETCLISYETDSRDSGLDWEDDGSNIRFSSSRPQQALINSWFERNDVLTANLTDSDTQIDAFLSRDSIAEYNNAYPKQPLSKERCRGFYMQLDSFELVYEYSTGKPKVHLYVKRFRIAWDRDKVKAPPSGKSAGKKPALAAFIKRLFTLIKFRSQQSLEPGIKPRSIQYGNGHGNVPSSQMTNGQTNRPSEPQFMSQLPPRPDISSPNNIPTDLSQSSKLRGHLAHARTSEERQTSWPTPANAVILTSGRASEPLRYRSTSRSRISTDGNEHRRFHDPQESSPAQRPAPPLNQDKTTLQLESQLNVQRSPQDHPVDANAPNTLKPKSPERVSERPQVPFSPDQQLYSQIEASENVTGRSAQLGKDADTSTVDPWKGMTGIKASDVTVPKDQMEILDSDKPWYPPPAGQAIVHGNVPVALLDEWNKLAFRLNQEASSDKPESEEDDYHTSRNSPISGSYSASSDKELSDWCTSPERTQTRNVLPPESSPVRTVLMAPRRQRRVSSESQGLHIQHSESQVPMESNPVDEMIEQAGLTSAPEVADEQLSTEAAGPDDNNSHPAPTGSALQPNFETIGPNADDNSDEHGSDDDDSDDETSISSGTRPKSGERVSSAQPETNALSPEDRDDTHEQANGSNPGVEMGAPSNTEAAAAETHYGGEGDDSNGSSTDPEMDVAIPQPLSGSTQQEKSSPGLSSSMPAFPPLAKQIQVVETPAAALSKSHIRFSSQDGPEARQVNMGVQAQPAQSSSQSRILNTYPSNENSRGETSQESARSAPAAPHETTNSEHVMSTPLNNEAPGTQPTPWSASNPQWVSSGSDLVASSMPAASNHQSQSSKAFSSYRDLPPSSMLSIEDQGSPNVPVFTQETPSKPDRASPFKRRASELSNGERGSPIKRTKVDELKRDGISRTRDSWLSHVQQKSEINSIQSREAIETYERFQGAYPSYKGDFEYFKKQCARLQAFREGGSLQRSFLWDDFIIKHLEDYHAYVENCLENQTKSLSYEDYFAASFSKPTYKRRSLTVEGIDACAAQVAAPEVPHEQPEINDLEASFPASLQDRFTNLHAHSFAAAEGPSSQITEPENDDSQASGNWSPSQPSIPDSEPARAAARSLDEPDLETIHETTEQATTWDNEDGDEDENMEDADDDIEMDMDETAHETASVELGDEEPTPAPTVPGWTPSPPRVEKPTPSRNHFRGYTPRVSVPTSASNKTPAAAAGTPASQNKPASVSKSFNKPPAATTNPPTEIEPSAEPSSEPPRQAQAQAQANPEREEADVEPEEEEEDPDLNENWFTSLRHIFPSPSSAQRPWSDDRNTNFKEWARADQNVFAVRNRRGGVGAQFDERGVVTRFATQPKENNE